jgi:hypothetical protein
VVSMGLAAGLKIAGKKSRRSLCRTVGCTLLADACVQQDGETAR